MRAAANVAAWSIRSYEFRLALKTDVAALLTVSNREPPDGPKTRWMGIHAGQKPTAKRRWARVANELHLPAMVRLRRSGDLMPSVTS
jgi:hypothetical protein